MKCYECKDKISLYIDGMLTPEENESLEAHLKVCDQCSKVYEQTYELVNILKQTEPVKLPQNFHDELMSRVKAEKQIDITEKKGRIIRWNYKKIVPIAAALLIGFVLCSSDTIINYSNSEYSKSMKQKDVDGIRKSNSSHNTVNEQVDRGRSIGLNESDNLYNNAWYIDINSEDLFIKEITRYLDQKHWTYTIDDVGVRIDNATYDELLEWLQEMEVVTNIEATGDQIPPFTIIYNN